MTRKREKEEGGLKEAALAALANTEDGREPDEIEADLGLDPGRLDEWLRADPEFRKRLAESMSPEHYLLTKSSIMKSLAAKAREGSIQHQKFFMELGKREKGPVKPEKMIVELRITPVDPED